MKTRTKSTGIAATAVLRNGIHSRHAQHTARVSIPVRSFAIGPVITEIALDDIDDAPPVAVPRTISEDVMSRKSYRERRSFERFDDIVTQVENILPMAAEIAKGAR